MKKYRAIVQSLVEPKDHEVIWHYKRRLFYYNNGWEPFLVYTDPWIMEQITSLNSVASEHHKSINSLQYNVATMKGWTQQVPGLITRVGGLETGQGRIFADINTLISRMDETQGKANANEENVSTLIQRVDTIQGLADQVTPLTKRVDNIQGIANSNKTRLDAIYNIEKFEHVGFDVNQGGFITGAVLNDNDLFFIRGANHTNSDNKRMTWSWFRDHCIKPLIPSGGGGSDTDLTELTSRVDSLKTNVDGLKSTVLSVDNRVVELETSSTDLTNKYNNLNSQVKTVTDVSVTMSEDLTTLQDSHNNLKQSVVEHSAKIAALWDWNGTTFNTLGDNYEFPLIIPDVEGVSRFTRVKWSTLRDNYIKPLVGSGSSGGGDYSAVITDLQNTVAGHGTQIHSLKTRVDEVTDDFNSLTGSERLSASEIADTICFFGQRAGSSGEGFVQVPVGAFKDSLNVGNNSEAITNLQSAVSRLDNTVGDVKDDIADLGLRVEGTETEVSQIQTAVGSNTDSIADLGLRCDTLDTAANKVNNKLYPFIKNCIERGGGNTLEDAILQAIKDSETVKVTKPNNPVDIYNSGISFDVNSDIAKATDRTNNTLFPMVAEAVKNNILTLGKVLTTAFGSSSTIEVTTPTDDGNLDAALFSGDTPITFSLPNNVLANLSYINDLKSGLSTMLSNQKTPEDLVCESFISSGDIVVTKPDIAGAIYENPITLSLTAAARWQVLRGLYSKFVPDYYAAVEAIQYGNVTTDQALSMVKYMSQLGITADYDYKLYNADIPAIILTIPGDKEVSFWEGAHGSTLRYITFKSTTKPDSTATEINFGKTDKAFADCANLVTIDGIIKPSATSELERTFENCTSLVNLRIKGIVPANHLDLSTCPVLSQESLRYIIENKNGNDSMNLPLHPDVLAAVPADMKAYYESNYQVTVL